VIALTGLLAAVIVFFWAILSQQAFLWEDVPEQWYPMASYTASELRAGRFPLWNPYIFGGIPFFAMIDVGVLYPLNWLLLIFVDNMILRYIAVEFHLIAHVYLIGVSMYVFCRNTSLSHGAAFVAGLIYMLCGVTVHQMLHPGIIFSITWFPMVFMLFMKAVDQLNFSYAIVTGGLLGILILSGSPQIFVYVSYTLGFYSLFCAIERFRSYGFHFSLLRLAAVSTVVMITGVCLAAVNLLPLFELIDHSLRPNVTYDIATTYALYPQELITLFMPDFFGRTEPSNWDYWGPGRTEYGHFWETYAYIGVLPLLLVCVSFTLKRTRITWFMGILAILTFILSLGDTTPIFRLVFDVIPGFDRFRSPGRLNILSGFAVAILSGVSVDSLCHLNNVARSHLMRLIKIICGVFTLSVIIYIVSEEPITAWLAGGVALQHNAKVAMATQAGPFTLLLLLSIGFLFTCARQKLRHAILIMATAVLIFLDLYIAGHEFNASPNGPAFYYSRSSLIDFLEKDQGVRGGRARTRDGANLLVRRNAGMLYRVFTLEGYVSPLRLANTVPPMFADELMNVKYRILVDSQGGKIELVDNPDTMPHAFVVRNYVLAPDREAVTKVMSDPNFDYKTTVTLDRNPSLNMDLSPLPVVEQAKVVHYEPNNMTITVDMKEPGLLIVGEVFYPAWKAYVDGREQTIYRANDTMRAIPLTTGSHRVDLKYKSGLFQFGGVISGITLMTVLINIGILRKRRHDHKNAVLNKQGR